MYKEYEFRIRRVYNCEDAETMTSVIKTFESMLEDGWFKDLMELKVDVSLQHPYSTDYEVSFEILFGRPREDEGWKEYIDLIKGVMEEVEKMEEEYNL